MTDHAGAGGSSSSSGEARTLASTLRDVLLVTFSGIEVLEIMPGADYGGPRNALILRILILRIDGRQAGQPPRAHRSQRYGLTRAQAVDLAAALIVAGASAWGSEFGDALDARLGEAEEAFGTPEPPPEIEEDPNA